MAFTLAGAPASFGGRPPAETSQKRTINYNAVSASEKGHMTMMGAKKEANTISYNAEGRRQPMAADIEAAKHGVSPRELERIMKMQVPMI